MSDEAEYVSNPRLRILSEELRILNDILIKRNLPDSVRLFQLRDFAQASKHITGVTLPALALINEDSDSAKWQVRFVGGEILQFDTPAQAINAYKANDIAKNGINSQFHPDARIDDSHLFCEDLPTGVRITPEGRYMSAIATKYLGIFNTVQEASDIYNQASAARSLDAIAKRQASAEELCRIKTPKPKATPKPKVSEEELYNIKATNAARARAARSLKSAAKRQASEERYQNTVLPIGVRMTPGGMFQARIRTGSGATRQEIYLGVFDTPEVASNAFKQAHANYHGKASPYFNELQSTEEAA